MPEENLNLYELINPSDPYTFKAKNIVVAGVAVALISTSYGAEQVDPKVENPPRTPILVGWADWLYENNIDAEWIEENHEDIAAALDSFLIGGQLAREDIESAMAEMPEETAKKWRNERQERHRSSLNRIGEIAYETAKHLRKKYGGKNGN